MSVASSLFYSGDQRAVIGELLPDTNRSMLFNQTSDLKSKIIAFKSFIRRHFYLNLKRLKNKNFCISISFFTRSLILPDLPEG